MAKYAMPLEALLRRFGTPSMPVLVDVRRREAYDKADTVIPTAHWRDHKAATDWAREIARGREVVVYCVRGHQVSEAAAALLRAAGVAAFYLEGGIEAWRAAGAPLVAKAALERYRPNGASQWVTREAPRSTAWPRSSAAPTRRATTSRRNVRACSRSRSAWAPSRATITRCSSARCRSTTASTAGHASSPAKPTAGRPSPGREPGRRGLPLQRPRRCREAAALVA